MPKYIAVAMLLAVLGFASPAVGNPFVWGLSSNVQIDQPVEQQTPWIDDGGPGQPWWPNDTGLWVNNPTACAWDVDDHWQIFANGTVESPAVYNFCSIIEPTSIQNTLWGQEGWWSFPQRTVGVSVQSKSDALTVQICFDGCTTLTREASGRNNWNYHGCVIRSRPVGDPAIDDISGSNGGIGLRATGTITVLASKRASATGIAEISGGFGGSSYC